MERSMVVRIIVPSSQDTMVHPIQAVLSGLGWTLLRKNQSATVRTELHYEVSIEPKRRVENEDETAAERLDRVEPYSVRNMPGISAGMYGSGLDRGNKRGPVRATRKRKSNAKRGD